MKFLFDKDGLQAINSALIRKIAVSRGNPVSVVAESTYGHYVILKEFATGDEDEDFSAAKIYLAKLVESLNGGQE